MRSDLKFPTMMILGLIVAVVCAQETPAPKVTAPPETPKPASPPKVTTPPETLKPAAPPKVTPSNTKPNDYIGEQFRQLRGEIEGIKEAYDLQLRKAAEFEAEVKQLQTTHEAFKRGIALKFASHKDIKELASSLMQLDKNRLIDREVTSEQIDALLKLLKEFTATPVQSCNCGNGNNPPPAAEYKFREHVVQAGEFLSTILEAYNGAFKKEGLKGRVTQSQVLKANPGLKADRLLIGQKLRIPLPGERNR